MTESLTTNDALNSNITPENNANQTNESSDTPLDAVTALQDTIDSFSLSLFEALRTLRDAVAPDSNTQNNTLQLNNYLKSETDGDYQDFKAALQLQDPHVLELLQRTKSANENGKTPIPTPKSRQEYSKMLSEMEREQDVELVSKLADEVLQKSENVDKLVKTLPGMERGKKDQLRVLEQLLQENWKYDRMLDEEYEKATHIREEVRVILQENTCDILGIEEEV